MAKTPMRRAPALLVLLVLLCRCLPAGAAEDCSDLARIPDCPPPPGPCLGSPCPPQDCSTCTAAFDDDGDCALDEEILNGVDDDQDGLVDEDISCLNTCDPMNYACPTTQVAAGDLQIPSPLDAPMTLPLAIRRYGCSGAEATRQMNIVVEPDPVDPNPSCGNWMVRLTILDAAGRPILQGPALLIFSRRWESLESTLLPGGIGNVQAFRFIVKGDLSRVVPFGSLPAELQIPCIESRFPHVFFYGGLDVAMDSSAPSNRRLGLVLHHAPSSLSHPDVFAGENCENDRNDAGTFVVVDPWSTDASYVEDPAPATPTEYKLEVRCTTSRIACVGETILTIVAGTTPTATPTATPDRACAGAPITLDAGACPTCACDWSASSGVDPADTCAVTVGPDVTTTYTVVLVDTASGCASTPASVTVTVVDVIAANGARDRVDLRGRHDVDHGDRTRLDLRVGGLRGDVRTHRALRTRACMRRDGLR